MDIDAAQTNRDRLLETIRSFDGILELAPGEGGEFPRLAWGDFFFYYAPDGVIPTAVQPYATIVTKDYPDDRLSELDPAGRWRVNIHVGSASFTELVGESPRDVGARGLDAPGRDFSEPDVFLPHPVYGSLGWIAVVNPGARTMAAIVELLRAAHEQERRRVIRRAQARADVAARDGAGDAGVVDDSAADDSAG
ncbi:DUF6194 family protein [Compostimonas suwonensis]|nr:DUF6194 family protein [Compostimonas suwonensis]